MHGQGKEGTDSPIATGTAASGHGYPSRRDDTEPRYARARANPAQFQRSFWRARAHPPGPRSAPLHGLGPLRSSCLLSVWHASSSFSLPLLVQQCSSSFIISPLRSSFLLFGHLASSLLLFLYLHPFASSFVISPLPSSFLLFLHHPYSSSYIICPLRSPFSFPFITFPLRSRAAGHVGRVLGDFSFYTSMKPDTAVSAYVSLLRSSCPEAAGEAAPS